MLELIMKKYLKKFYQTKIKSQSFVKSFQFKKRIGNFLKREYCDKIFLFVLFFAFWQKFTPKKSLGHLCLAFECQKNSLQNKK
jgi:hypothetical protein